MSIKEISFRLDPGRGVTTQADFTSSITPSTISIIDTGKSRCSARTMRSGGNIAVETATRQKLFDEYAARVFEARSDIATAVADIRSLNRQVAAAEAALPVLRHLADKLSRQGTTIFLTIHYMDEAARCTDIGFIQGGRLIAKGSPLALKQGLQSKLLEVHVKEVMDGMQMVRGLPDV